MPDEKQQKEHHAPVWGILLLFLGIIFLLQNLNVLPWGLWGTLWRFWPVLIIAIGLTILLRYHNVWLVSTLTLALLFACLGIAIWQYGAPPPAEKITNAYSEPLEGLEQAQITELNMDVDLSNYIVKVPFTAGSVHVYINADLSNLEIIIPDGVAVKLVADADLSILKVDENRFPRKGDYYTSQDFASAKNRIELELNCDLSRVQVK